MTLEELIAEARTRADDKDGRELWSDAEWTSYANDAEREACRRARLLVDSTTAEICMLMLEPGAQTLDLDPRILFIRRARLAGATRLLTPIHYRDLDEHRGAEWQDETGEPTHHVLGMDELKFRPYPTPNAEGVVQLTVARLPLEDMLEGEHAPEIRAHHHMGLVDWMLYRAYSKQDSETLDKARAATHMAAFEAEFGKRSSAQDEIWIAANQGIIEGDGVY
jgi:hypothetical protein